MRGVESQRLRTLQSFNQVICKTKEEETKMQKQLRYSSRLRGKSEAAEASGKQHISFQLPSPQMKEGVITQSYMTEMMQEEHLKKSTNID